MTTDEIFRRRLLFVVGKGGVGRTTVTVALALEAARRGRRVLAIELEGSDALALALEAQRSEARPAPELERIECMEVDGRRALEEYLGLVIPIRRLLKTVFSSSVYQYFVAAAPGLKELMTVGKIWYEADRREREGEGADLVLVDAPATGHSLQYLRMPSAAAETFGVGLVRREAERVVGLLRDRAATAVVIVTTAEEMPANETLEISRGVGELGMASAALVVNRVHVAPASRGELDALASAAGRPPAAPREAGLRREVLARAEEELRWAEINRREIDRLRAELPLPEAELPYLFGEEFGAREVRWLSRRLAAELDAADPPEAKGA